MLLVCLAVVAACGSPIPSPSLPTPASLPSKAPNAGPTLTPTPMPTIAATPRPTPSVAATPNSTPAPTASRATPAFPDGSVIVTFEVELEEFRVLLTEPDDIQIARQLLAGEEVPPIPNGLVLPGDGGVNGPWSWHIDPRDIEFADVATEVCDGLPSFVENGFISGDRYCPWGAQVVAVEPADG